MKLPATTEAISSHDLLLVSGELKQTHEFLCYNAHITTPSQIGTFLEEAVQHQAFQIWNY